MTNKEAAYILSDKCDDYTVEELSTAFDLAIKALEDRPQGEWIDTGMHEEYWEEEYQCSICGGKSYYHNYCPNCGAKMK